MLYNITYYSQIDCFSEHINQIVEIPLRFFIHTLEDVFLRPEMLPYIQSILNHTSSSTINKTLNEIVYGFFLCKPLDLLSDPLFSNTFQACTDVTNAISFALVNQKAHYNFKHKFLFIKIENYTILRLHKGYTIPFFTGVTKKLTQQYVSLFYVFRKVGWFAYKLDVPLDWRMHPVFLVAQLQSAPSSTNDLFYCPRLYIQPVVFVVVTPIL